MNCCRIAGSRKPSLQHLVKMGLPRAYGNVSTKDTFLHLLKVENQPLSKVRRIEI